MSPQNKKRDLACALAGTACCLAWGLCGCADAPSPTAKPVSVPADPTAASVRLDGQTTRSAGQIEVASIPHEIDRPYLSMMGPSSRQELVLLARQPVELVWITGARARMVDAAAGRPMPDRFMAQASLALDGERHRAIFGFDGERADRVLALAQGQLEIQFPPGFGIPLRSDEGLQLTTQVLNLNPGREVFQVRHHVTIDFAAQRDLPEPMQPLYLTAVPGLKSLESRAVAYDVADEFFDEQLKSSCSLPGSAFVDTAAQTIDRFARRYTDHWVLEPGHEENHTRVTTLMNLTSDTTIHFIGAHLHPFAQSIELRDLTGGETIFKAAVFNAPAQSSSATPGLARVETLSSAEGLMVYREHEYELISVYDNTSGSAQNAMATLYLYMLDPQFKLPATVQAVAP